MEQLKDVIVKEVGRLFSDAGFKFVKSKFQFKKAMGKNTVLFQFNFYHGWPIYQSYHFLFWVNIPEIQMLIEQFYSSTNMDPLPPWQVLITEGDFIPGLKGKERKFRADYISRSNTLEEANAKVLHSLEILKNDAFPLANLIGSLSGYQEYFLSSPNEISNNFADTALFLSSLAAAYLKGLEEYKILSDFLKNELDRYSYLGTTFTRCYKYLEAFDLFVAGL